MPRIYPVRPTKTFGTVGMLLGARNIILSYLRMAFYKACFIRRNSVTSNAV